MAGFKVGDVVVLKSGSPTMTVTRTEGEAVGCHWFHGDGAHDGSFPEAALVKFEAPRPSRYSFR